MTEETYLGDGLYAGHDGYYIRLRAPRYEGDHVVFLEPSVWAALRDFVDCVIKEQAANDQTT